MKTILMKSESHQISERNRFILSLKDKINLSRSDQYIALCNLSIFWTWKTLKNLTKGIDLKHKLQHGMTNRMFD